MWKSLQSNDNVFPGDQIRYSGNSSFTDKETLYKVTKADQYYFEIAPIALMMETASNSFAQRIIRYFDVGHHLFLEVWTEE